MSRRPIPTADGSSAARRTHRYTPARRIHYRAATMLTLSLLVTPSRAGTTPAQRTSTGRSPSAARPPPRAWAPTWPAQARARAHPVLAGRARAPDAGSGAAASRRRPTVVVRGQALPGRASRCSARLRKIDGKVHHVMIVGHDPGMHGLATGAVQAPAMPTRCRRWRPSFPPPAWPSSRFKARELVEDRSRRPAASSCS